MKDTTQITGFHAHIYFDTSSRDAAARVREGLGASFEVQLGRWHDKPIGPHPKAMYLTSCSIFKKWGCKAGKNLKKRA